MGIAEAFVVPHPPLLIPGVADEEKPGVAQTTRAYAEVGRRIARLDPDTLVISSPHATAYRDYLHISPGAGAEGSFAAFGAPRARYRCAYDEDFVARLDLALAREGLPAGSDHERDRALDHGTMIPLHFVGRGFAELGMRPHYRVVRLGISGISRAEHYRVGRAIQQVAAELGRRCVYVASGDLSHKLAPEGPYGFATEGPRFDRLFCEAMRASRLEDLLTVDPSLAERAAECGLRSFQLMCGALDRTAVSCELLSYEGPYGVGYGVADVSVRGTVGGDEGRDRLAAYEAWRRGRLDETRANEDPYVRLARRSLEAYVRTGRQAALPDGLPDELTGTCAGCFVSLHADGELRGCIGTTGPTRASLAEEIRANAIAAGTRDPRFPRVRADELDGLVYDVDVLGPLEPAAGLGDLDPTRYGVVVSTTDGRRGLLLPDLDGVDDAREQVRIAARKGGIDLARDRWGLERFEVVRHL